MRIFVLCDDHWHPARTVQEGLIPLAEQGYEFEWCSDGRDWSARRMESSPLVILSKSNNVTAADESAWVTPEVETAFRDYVRHGHGLLAIHSGTVYKECTTLRALLGGAFLQHPKQCPVTVTPQAGPLRTAGVSPFTATDEHYFMQLDDKNASVFMTSQSDNGLQPAGWTRGEGAGRVCVLTPGHNLEVWLQPAYQVLLANALRWCSGTPMAQ
jgi:type 1 glutamine amidotransferase